jgi:hypothetical protein
MHPHSLLATACAALALSVGLMLATAPDLGSLDFSLGTAQTGGAGAAAPAEVQTTQAPPAWLADPLASPLEALDPRVAEDAR